MSNDLIDRDALLQQLRDGGYGEGWLFDQIRAAPAVQPRVAIGIHGGTAQWALADRPGVRVDIVDYDLDTFDEDEDYSLVRDESGDESAANAYEETPGIDPDYFRNLDLAPTCTGNGELRSQEADAGKFHIITDVMQCGPDGVHESFNGYYAGTCEEALAEHEKELRFFYGDHKTGPAGRQIYEPVHA